MKPDNVLINRQLFPYADKMLFSVLQNYGKTTDAAILTAMKILLFDDQYGAYRMRNDVAADRPHEQAFQRP